MDIFGFPFSDDDEEEYTPPIEETDGDKENDNYILELEPEIIPLPENIFNTVNMETSTIAERTRARGTNHEEVESEIPFDSLQFNQNAMDPELKEKEEYRKFVQGVFFNDHDGNPNAGDGDDGDDEDYIPPKEVAPELSYKKRISQKEVNSVVLDKQIRAPERPIKPRLFSSSIVPNLTPQPISLNSMQFVVLQTQLMCFAQLLIQMYLLCSKSPETKELLGRIRSMLLSLKAASHVTKPTITEQSSGPGSGSGISYLQALGKLSIFNSVNPSNHPTPSSLANVLDYEAIQKVFDMIDNLYSQMTVPAIQSTKTKKAKAKPLDLSEDPIYCSIMDSFNSMFEPKLKPSVTPSNKLGGYGSTGRLQFTPSEDKLLALGVTLLGDDYDLISKELLVTKDIKQLRNRSKNQRNNRGNNNIIRHYYSLYTDFLKWDKNVYSQMCEIITTHVTSWQVMQRLHFYFYGDITLKYYWLYSYFQLVKRQRAAKINLETPLFLTTPRVETAERSFVQQPIPIRSNPLQQIRVNPDPSAQIYEKDVILDSDFGLAKKTNNKTDFLDKRVKASDDIEREELSDEEM